MIVSIDPGVFELSVIGMPSPMDECENVMNIDHPANEGLKRKLDGSLDELVFRCKKVAISPIKPTTPDSKSTPTAPTPATQKLSKAERDAQKAEKAKERELERQKKEQEKLKREEEKRKKDEEKEEEKRKRDEEKQKREQEREEEKQRREEERLKKQAERDELKKKKDAEKEEARKDREKKEREKDEQRRKKEEEIEKKNKAQLRLNNFFSVPKKKPESPSQPVETISDYQRYFQPFHVRQDVVIAPTHQFMRDPSTLPTSAALIDNVLSHPDSTLPNSISQRLDTLIPACKYRRPSPCTRSPPHTAKELISLINEPPSAIDPYALIKSLPRKHLQYAEDVRPAYNGTFTRRTNLTPRNPFKKDNEIFAYDYDSEAEWEFEPEEGENLDEESAADEDEMGSMMGDSGDEEDRAFLDDEDDVEGGAKKGKPGKRFVAPLVPMIKGVCWEVEGVQNDEVLAGMRASVLLFDEKGDGLQGPIDPLSSQYWVSDMPPPPPPKMDPQLVMKKVDANGGVESVKTRSKSKTPFPEALLGDFVKAIQGSAHNQTLLVELLKKQFPTATKGGITEKLKQVAFRTGKKDTDHWEIRKEVLAELAL